MTEVNVVESVAASADKVWGILSDFGGIAVGGAIEAFDIEGEGVGAVRTITMNGGQIIERLEVLDPDNLTFAYAILNDDNPLPVAGYSARVEITADGTDACTVNWTGSFEAKNTDEDAACDVVRGIYTGGIQRARKTLGV